MDKTKPFGLVLSKRAKTIPVKSSAVFDSDSDDEPAKKKACPKIPQAKPLSKIILAEQYEDPSIYEYDSIYDDMKAKEVSKAAPKSDKPSRYIDSLLKAADKRKKNYERRLEKKVQVEREKEGDKFIDKEAFVTSAYKKKMQEMEEEEERERRENQLNEMMDVTKQKDLSGFYRHFLKQSVGEESIPVFGERIDIKKEPGTESNPVEAKKEDVLQNDAEPNLDQDSDIVSSSDDEASGSEKVLPSLNFEKANESSRSNEFEGSRSSDDPKKKTKKYSHRQLRKKAIDSDDELETTETDVMKSQRHLKKTDGKENVNDFSKNKEKVEKKTHRKEPSNHDDADSDSSHGSNPRAEVTQVSEIANELSETRKAPKSTNDVDPELKKTEKRRNIFQKRTVGSVFTDAQTRYFQRMAASSA